MEGFRVPLLLLCLSVCVSGGPSWGGNWMKFDLLSYPPGRCDVLCPGLEGGRQAPRVLGLAVLAAAAAEDLVGRGFLSGDGLQVRHRPFVTGLGCEEETQSSKLGTYWRGRGESFWSAGSTGPPLTEQLFARVFLTCESASAVPKEPPSCLFLSETNHCGGKSSAACSFPQKCRDLVARGRSFRHRSCLGISVHN